MSSYSISVRLQRTTVEEAYVSVPVTDVVMREPDEDGTVRLDPQKVFAAAVELGAEADWLAEERQVGVHPVQKAPDRVTAPGEAPQ